MTESSLLLLEWPPSLPRLCPKLGGTLVQWFSPSFPTGASTSFSKAAVSSMGIIWVDHPQWGGGTGRVDPFGSLEESIW